jgi:hypothetical protein
MLILYNILMIYFSYMNVFRCGWKPQWAVRLSQVFDFLRSIHQKGPWLTNTNRADTLVFTGQHISYLCNGHVIARWIHPPSFYVNVSPSCLVILPITYGHGLQQPAQCEGVCEEPDHTNKGWFTRCRVESLEDCSWSEVRVGCI